MNWLAHAFLSEPDAEFRLGNLLADLVRGEARKPMSEAFLRGVACHQRIDQFTDAHPVVWRSIERISPENRRFSGILVDIFYDHFLARDWALYCAEPLNAFTAEIYTALQLLAPKLTGEAKEVVQRIVAEDRLASYRTVEGIEAALARLSARFIARRGRTFDLRSAIDDLTSNTAQFAEDFREFFPDLQRYVSSGGEAT